MLKQFCRTNCQFARTQETSIRKKIIRVVAINGGIESYDILDNGMSIAGRQSIIIKWLMVNLPVEKSFKKNVVKHLKLIRCYICILLDRRDTRLSNKNWFIDKWNNNVNY